MPRAPLVRCASDTGSETRLDWWVEEKEEKEIPMRIETGWRRRDGTDGTTPLDFRVALFI